MGKEDQRVQSIVAVGNPTVPGRVLLPQADGSLNVNATVVASIGDFAVATAADPTYVEGNPEPGSVDLSGHLRVQDPAVATAETTGTIASGGASQTALVAKPARRFLLIYNDDSTEVLRYRFGGNASSASCGIPPGGTALFDKACPSGLLSLLATTTGHKFALQEG